MHEVRIAQSLSELVLNAAQANDLSKVTRVNLVFGSMIHIVPEIFEFAFREAVGDSIASASEINIEVIPVKLRCRECGVIFTPGNDLYACPGCNSDSSEIISGKELFVKSIEGE